MTAPLLEKIVQALAGRAAPQDAVQVCWRGPPLWHSHIPLLQATVYPSIATALPAPCGCNRAARNLAAL